jgi:hypothetical protein
MRGELTKAYAANIAIATGLQLGYLFRNRILSNLRSPS